MQVFNIIQGEDFLEEEVYIQEVGFDFEGMVVKSQLRRSEDSNTVIHEFPIQTDTSELGFLKFKLDLPKAISATMQGVYFGDIYIYRDSPFYPKTYFSKFKVVVDKNITRP